MVPGAGCGLPWPLLPQLACAVSAASAVQAVARTTLSSAVAILANAGHVGGGAFSVTIAGAGVRYGRRRLPVGVRCCRFLHTLGASKEQRA